MDWERYGRALIEYAGVTFAAFIVTATAVTYFTQGRIAVAFYSQIDRFYLYYILNFWVVLGVFAYRKNRRRDVVLEGKREIGLAFLVTAGWIFVQPFLLISGYVLFLIAVWKQDRLSPFLHPSLLPDLADEEEIG